MMLITLALAAAAAGCVVAALHVRRSTGVPWGRIVSEDTRRQRPAVALSAPQLGLTGRPDYLLERHDGTLVPVEVKPGRRARRPYDSDVLQLAAYCVLVEEAYGRRPPYGLLQYARHTFQLRYDAAVRAEVLATLAAMHAALDAADAVDRDHADGARCRACALAGDCEQALV